MNNEDAVRWNCSIERPACVRQGGHASLRWWCGAIAAWV